MLMTTQARGLASSLTEKTPVFLYRKVRVYVIAPVFGHVDNGIRYLHTIMVYHNDIKLDAAVHIQLGR